MKNKKKIVILHTINHFNKYSKIERNFNKNNLTIIIAFSIELRIFLKTKKINYNIQEEYLSKISKKKLDEDAFNLSQIWHGDLFKFKGFSLGLICQYDLHSFFSRIIRNFQFILKIIEIEKPFEIISFEDNNNVINEFNTALNYLCSLKKIIIKIIPKQNLILSNLSLSKQIIKRPQIKSKRMFFQEYFYFFLSKILFFIKVQSKKKKNIFITHSKFHNSILEELEGKYNLFLLADHLSKKDLLLNIKNLLGYNKGAFHVFLGLFSSFRFYIIYYYNHNIIFKKTLKTRKFFDNFNNQCKKFLKESNLKEIFFYQGISIWPIVKSKIYETIFYDFKRFIKNILIYFKFLKLGRFKVILLPNDAKEKLRALSLICTSIKIPTIIAQHGMISSREGLVPFCSTIFAAWGKNSNRILKEFGMETKKIVITGSPRLDEYLSLNRNEKLKKFIRNNVYKHFKINKNIRLIVLTTNHSEFMRRFNTDRDPIDVERMISFSINAVKNIDNSHLIIKLHPGDHHVEIPLEIKKMLKTNNVSITKSYDIKKLLVACNCLIAEESTTVLEAMLLKKPVICLKFKELDYLSPILEYHTAHKASNLEELIQKIKKSFEEPIPLKNYDYLLKDYLYKLDGLSTKRVIKLINNLSS